MINSLFSIISILGIGSMIVHSLCFYKKTYLPIHKKINERVQTNWWWIYPFYFLPSIGSFFPNTALFFNLKFVFLGFSLLIFGLWLIYYSRNTLKDEWSPFVEVHKTQKWVTHGPYKFVSHPIYIGEVLGGLGTFLLTGNILVLFFLLLLIFVLVHKASAETKLLYKWLGAPNVLPVSRRILLLLKEKYLSQKKVSINISSFKLLDNF